MRTQPADSRRRSADIKAMAVFLVVAFLASGALGALQPATGIPGEVIQLVQFGPALGVGLVALLRPGRVRELFAGGGPDGGARKAPGALLLLTPPLIVAVIVGAYAVLAGDVGPTRPTALFALIAVAQLTGACGEEIGWRCFLQPLLRTRLGPFAASVVVGLVWGLWHVQVFTRHPVYAAAFVVAAVSMSVVLGWALDGVRAAAALPLAGIFHTLINLGLLLFLDEESGEVLPMVLFGVACLAAAGLWTWRSARGPRPAASAPAPTPAPARISPIMDDAR
ncbi:CPBP family intramembrane glutamic endopeptidase [Streptomyces sp. NPDC052496]|uniref:CPBP family intramembrane glutamic endopeptidase n=1 Tax=Streptomyces sp. NPDC052496 TaxID=3154951 RepID=UPI00343FAA70